MRRCDAVVVGGGPAGSTCAWALRRGGRDVVLIDRAAFPRDKVCAGWVTPAVIGALDLGGGGGGGPVVAAQEFEVELQAGEADSCAVRPEVPELYFAPDLKGYGWCFRKQGVVNVGYGRFGGEGLAAHVASFVGFLRG